MDELARAIDQLVRPLIEADGGAIELVEFSDDVATVRMSGRCGGCPGAPYTRGGVIEPALSNALGRPIRVKMLRGPTKIASTE